MIYHSLTLFTKSKGGIEEAKSYYEELVNNKFNFNLNENIDLDFEKDMQDQKLKIDGESN